MKKNKTRALAVWMYQEVTFSTSEVLRWGVDNYCNGADRIARKLRQLGLLRRVDWKGSKEEAYQVNIEEMELYLQK